ncbi:13926_t:CDS:2 [Gigaspora margarita]|uniref:13926_t:CDS:1 n=1 Tax=Gigaspora margarita TaxID=4874 RepID=A0ABN7VR65_GIGMA|nr:13926_t:CDS:2 [Gigaspora margarita]
MAVTIFNQTIVPINIVAIHNYIAFINYSKYMYLKPGEECRISCKRTPTRFFIWQYSGPNSEISDTALQLLCATRAFISAINMGLSEVKHVIAEQVLDIAAISIQNTIMHQVIDHLIMEIASEAFTTITNRFTDRVFLDWRVERGQMKTIWAFDSVSRNIQVQGGPVLSVNQYYKVLYDGKFYLNLD